MNNYAGKKITWKLNEIKKVYIYITGLNYLKSEINCKINRSN